MITGTYLKIPEPGDRGSTFCPAISESLTTLDSHSHNGINSPLIAQKDITKGVTSVASTDFTADASGDVKATVTLPSGYSSDVAMFKFVVTSGAHIGREVNPTVIKNSPTSIDIYLMSAQDLSVVIC